jgi:hypothetical protein
MAGALLLLEPMSTAIRVAGVATALFALWLSAHPTI